MRQKGKEMKKTTLELGIPSYIAVETEEKAGTWQFEGTKWTDGDVCVEVESGKVFVQAQTSRVNPSVCVSRFRFAGRHGSWAAPGREPMEIPSGWE